MLHEAVKRPSSSRHGSRRAWDKPRRGIAMRFAVYNPIYAAADVRMCVRANRWAQRRTVRRTFAVVSRLGDGPLWYAVLALLPWLGGERGLPAALHMAV